MDPNPVIYRAFLLRLWRVDDAGSPVWRASLEAADTGERIGFSDLRQLFAFIATEGVAIVGPTDGVNAGEFTGPA